MNSKQTISTESVGPVASRFETNRISVELSPDAVAMRAASLLLGVQLRGELTNREREFLDSVAGDHALVFLVHGEGYLHPQDVALFSADLIDATVRMGRDAVFSHRCDSGADENANRRVYTGLIGAADDRPLVLGMFVPEDLRENQAAADRFPGPVALAQDGDIYPL